MKIVCGDYSISFEFPACLDTPFEMVLPNRYLPPFEEDDYEVKLQP